MRHWLAIAQLILVIAAIGVGQADALADGGSFGLRDVKSPRPQSWVVDQTETTSLYQQELINNLCADIQDRHNRELVVVVVESTHGKPQRRFATNLFNRWQLGAYHKNQGVLVFVAIKDRAAEIVLGVGIDTAKTRREAQAIMDRIMIPKFKANDAGGAIYDGVHACAKRILRVGQLGVPDKLPKISAEQAPVLAEQMPDESDANPDSAQMTELEAGSGDSSLETGSGPETGATEPNDNQPNLNDVAENSPQQTPVSSFIPVTYTPELASPRRRASDSFGPPVNWPSPYLLWGLGLGGVGLVGSFLGARHYLRYRQRSCDTCRLDRVLLTEVQDDDFLDKPEQLEESLGSVDYDVWACLECEDVVKLRYGRWFTRYSRCPECNYVTRFKIKRTILPATRRSSGLVEVTERCKNCTYRRTRRYSTPRLPSPSSGSRGGVFSSGSGGSSGGGFSSGGGASGRW